MTTRESLVIEAWVSAALVRDERIWDRHRGALLRTVAIDNEYPFESTMSQGPPAVESVRSPWGDLRSGLSRAVTPLVDFLFPPACLACGDALSAAIPSLCDECQQELTQPVGPRCQRCAAPVGPHLDTTSGCLHCRDERFAFRRVLALGAYDGPVRSAVLRGKHPHGAPLIAAMTDLLVETWIADLLSERFDAVVPVPHDWRRRFWKLHTPAETIGHQLARRLQRPYAPHILRKPRATPSQTRAPPSVRRRQQRGAFEASETVNLGGARLLLVDDVLTTGATAHAAATALRARNAADVIVAVLARGLGTPHVKG
jgi:predicted amidophosphoribosyltransferase